MIRFGETIHSFAMLSTINRVNSSSEFTRNKKWEDCQKAEPGDNFLSHTGGFLGNLPSEINHAWLRRMNQGIEESRVLVADLKRNLGIPLGPVTEDVLKSLNVPLAQLAEVLLLTAANARADGQWETAAQLIQLTENYLNANGEPLPFSLHFQKGIMAQVEGDFSSALEHFIAARLGAKEPWRQAAAVANSLFCLESLGLPLERSREELAVLLKRKETREQVPGVVSQIEAFELRYAFRRGVPSEVMGSVPRSTDEIDQIFYYRLWVSELPFHSSFRQLGPLWKENFSLSSPWFHQKSYRLRTLQGLLHPDDLENFKETEFSDRFYLWTWRWLSQPDEFPVERVMSLLGGVDLEEMAYRLSSEDFQLIRNALLWLGLFDPSSFQPISRLIQSIRPPQVRDFPLFEFEREVILYLGALRDRRETEAGDFLRNLSWHPLWRSKEIWLARLTTSLIEGKPGKDYPLAVLEEQLRRFLFKDPAAAGVKLTIDLAHARLITVGGQTPLLSAALCSAFELLHGKESVEAEELLRVCFGIPNLDPEIHNPKIFNLLSRMRKLAPPGLDFHMKSGRIYAQGSWAGVEFRRRHSLSGALQDCVQWKSIVRRAPARKPAEAETDRFVRPVQALKKLKGRGEMTREDLEELTGKSKSTASRMIARWLKQGVLKKTGKARNTRYLVVNKGALS